MIKVVARNVIKSNSIKSAIVLSDELVKLSQLEDGCISYHLYQDINQPQILTMIEEWASEDDLNRHMKSDHVARIFPLFEPLMEEETVINVYKQII